MLSYRDSLAQIGIAPDKSVSYKDFYSKPLRLRQTILAMQAPSSEDWSQVSDIYLDEDWTDEVQGVAWDGAHWIFATDARQWKCGTEDKSIYVFSEGSNFRDGNWKSRLKYKDVPHPFAGLTEEDDHWGQVTCYNGFVYVSHFWKGGPKVGQTNVVVFRNNGGFLTFERWIELDQPSSPTDGRRANAEFQAINPWDGMFYSCFGSGTIYELFIHDPSSGKYTGRNFKLDVPVEKVQGACFSPNGHLFIAANEYLSQHGNNYQTIWYYSALNGHRLGVIPVLAKEDDQELEGICYADLLTNGVSAQIHAVLLENRLVNVDNIFFKSFSSAKPHIV